MLLRYRKKKEQLKVGKIEDVCDFNWESICRLFQLGLYLVLRRVGRVGFLVLDIDLVSSYCVCQEKVSVEIDLGLFSVGDIDKIFRNLVFK